jgi:hypothetical protein
MIVEVFSHQKRGEKISKNHQIHILDFHSVAKNKERKLKIGIIFLV